MTCLYEQNTAQTAYQKGCRCERCRADKSEKMARRAPRLRPCRRCGGPKNKGSWYCETCSSLVLVDRIADGVTVNEDGCWVYRTRRQEGTYARLSRHGGRGGACAHTLMYEHFVGPIATGLELDHLCRNKECVNPDHLEAVTRSENIKRAKRAAALWREAQPVRAETSAA